MSETTQQNLICEIDEGVATLTLNRPKRKNALDGALFKALAGKLNELGDDDRVRVIVLQGAGGNFSSGMDLAGDFSEGSQPFDDCAAAVAAVDKPMIAAVDGVSIGGGATIPLHCDVVYVGRSLRMRFPFVNLGLVPEFSASYTLQAVIGPRAAAELMYTAEWIDADRALALGLASAVYDDAELHAAAAARAREMARWPRNSLVATKQCLKASWHQDVETAREIETRLMMQQTGSPENNEAIMAFIEKREPDFSAF